MTEGTVYIGLTGLSGAGKSTVADILMAIARDLGLRVCGYNLSDEIMDELARRGGTDDVVSRITLIELGNELRAAHGNGVLASRIVTQDSRARSAGNKYHLVSVTGIRNPGEVDTFRKKWGAQFILLAVVASQEVRILRVASRGQYGDDAKLSDEVEQADQDIGITACIRLADWRMRNEGTIDQLRSAVRIFFERYVASHLNSERPES